jgi:hypothetical protein
MKLPLQSNPGTGSLTLSLCLCCPTLPTTRRKVDWLFLEVHAEGEAEHAAIGHSAVLNMVPTSHLPILRKAMQVRGGAGTAGS